MSPGYGLLKLLYITSINSGMSETIFLPVSLVKNKTGHQP
jgi:hypothetical protein